MEPKVPCATCSHPVSVGAGICVKCGQIIRAK